MCGIFGLIVNKSSRISKEVSLEIIEKLFVLSETRGRESSGIAIKNTKEHVVAIVV